MRSKFWTILAALLLVASLAMANGQKEPAAGAAGKVPNIVVGAVTSLENEYNVDWDAGAKQAASALGVEFRLFVDNNSAARQIEIYEAQLQDGVKMFMGTSPFTGNILQIVDKVKAANAYYVGIWDCVAWFHPIDSGSMNYVTYFAPDDAQNVYKLCVEMFKSIGGKGNLVHITGWPGASVDVQRTMGVDRALKEFPGIKLLARQPGKWNQVDARRVMEDFIAAYPKIDCVFAQNDSEGLGAYHAIKDAGLKMVPIAGLDAPPEVMRLISEGEYFGSVGYTPGWEAAYSMARVYDAAHGFKFHPLERMMHFQGPILTGKNVKEYMDWVYADQKDRSGPPLKLPFDWRKMSRVLHPNDWDPQNWVYPMDVASIWAYAIDKKPAGYTLPKAYTDSLTNGDLEKIKKLYADHYKGNFTKQFKPSFFDHEKGF